MWALNRLSGPLKLWENRSSAAKNPTFPRSFPAAPRCISAWMVPDARCGKRKLKDGQEKQPDGSAKTREVKLAVVFSADSRDSHGKPTRDVGSASYNAAIESAATADVDESPSEFVTRAVEHELAGTAVRPESRRVKFPLIRSKQLGSVRVSPDRVAMLLEREDLDVSS